MSNRKTKEKKAPRPQLEFNNTLALVAALDAEWTRPGHRGKDPFEPFKNTSQAFIDFTTKYASVVERNGKAAGFIPDRGVIDQRLFNPQAWIPFGHANVLTFTLLDDIGASQSVIEAYPHTVEETSVAFCPVMKNYQPLWIGIAHRSRGYFRKSSNCLTNVRQRDEEHILANTG